MTGFAKAMFLHRQWGIDLVVLINFICFLRRSECVYTSRNKKYFSTTKEHTLRPETTKLQSHFLNISATTPRSAFKAYTFETATVTESEESGSEMCSAKDYNENYFCDPRKKFFLAHRKCILMNVKKVTFEEAKKLCVTKYHTHLADLDKNEQYNDIVEQAHGRLTRVWIGLASSRDNPKTFYWLKTRKKPTINRWAVHQPDNYGNNQFCVSLILRGEWYDEACNRKMAFFCDFTKEYMRYLVEGWTIKSEADREVNVFGAKTTVVCKGYAFRKDHPYVLYEGEGPKTGVKYKVFRKRSSAVPLEDDIISEKTEYVYHRQGDLCVRKTVFTLDFYITNNLVNGTVACCFHEDNPCSERSDIYKPFIVLARKPDVKTFSDQPELGAYIGGPLMCQCHARTGDSETATIALSTKPRSKCGLFWALIHLDKSIELHEAKERCVQLWSSDVKVKRMSKYEGGNVIVATIRMKATPALGGAVCSCFSYNAQEEITEKGFLDKSNELLSFTEFITVTYLPTTPVLNVDFHLEPNYVYADKELTALCEAFVGTDGSLIWSVSTNEREYVYNISTPVQQTKLRLNELDGQIINNEVIVICGTDFSVIGQTCLRVSNDARNWTEARRACKKLDAHLVHVTDAQSNQFLADYLESDGYWIGLNRFRTTEKFTWSDTGAEMRYAHWADKKDGFGISPDVTKCVYIRNGRWSPFFCNARLRYICEQPLRTIKDPKGSSNYGRIIKSTLSIRVTYDLDNATLRCDSSLKNITFGEDSDQFNIIYEPAVSITRTTVGNVQMLNVKCSSQLGKHRQMSLVFFSKGMAKYLYTIDIYGNITEQKPMPGIDFEPAKVEYENSTGFSIESEATLKVIKDLDNDLVISCFARKFSLDETLSPKDLKRMLEGNAQRLFETDKPSSEGKAVAVALSVFLLAFSIVVICFPLYVAHNLKEEEGEEETKQHDEGFTSATDELFRSGESTES